MTVKSFLGAEWGVGNSLYEESLQGTSSVVTDFVHSGTYSYKTNPVTTGTGYFQCTSPSGNLSIAMSYVEFWFRAVTISSAATGEEFLQLTDSVNGLKLALRLRSDGTIGVYNSTNTLLAVSNTVIVAGTWIHIGVRCGTGTSTTWELRINGFTDISGSAANLNASNLARVMIGKRTDRNSTTVDYRFDDLVVDDAQFNGTACRVVGRKPVVDTATADWNAGTGSAPYWVQIVTSPTDSATYIKNPAVANKVSLFNVEPLDAVTVLGVKPGVMYRLDTTGSASIKVRTVSGATTDDGSAVSVTSTFILFAGKLYTTDPNTGAAWYFSDLSAASFGVIETAGVQVRVEDLLVQVLYQDNVSPVALGATTFIAQENGTPYADNTYLNGSVESDMADPGIHVDTRKYDVFAGDLGFTYMGRDGYARILYGDTAGAGWKPPFLTFITPAMARTIASASNGVDLGAMSGAGSLTLDSSSSVPTSGIGYVRRAADGRQLYYSWTGRAGAVISGVKFIVASSAGATTVATGDAVASNGNWRSQVMARSTDFALHDGYTVADMQPVDSHGAALQLFDSPQGGSGSVMYSTALAVTSVVANGLWLTIKFTNPHGITHVGRSIKLSGFTSSTYNAEYPITAVLDQWTVTVFSSLVSNPTVLGTIQIATFTHALDPASSASATRVPSGGVVVPGVGAGGADRDYIFYVNVERWNASTGAEFSHCGIAYSDDVTQGFVNASDSGIITGANGTGGGGGSGTAMDISKFAGTASDTLTLQGSFLWNLNPTGSLSISSGVLEVDTSNGLAYLAFTGRSSATVLTGLSVVRGSGTLLGASASGARHAMFGNYAGYDSPHQQMWPWLHTDGYVYGLSIMGYRTNAAYLSRVAQASILDMSAWTYWDGTGWNTDKTKAKPIFSDAYGKSGPVNALGFTGVAAPVGECSLMFHAGVGLWIATYTGASGICVRTAPNAYGPWSAEALAIGPGTVTGGFYGGHVHPMSGLAPNATDKLYFHVSLTNAYTVMLTETSMTVTINKHLPGVKRLQAVARASRW